MWMTAIAALTLLSGLTVPLYRMTLPAPGR